MIASLPEKDVCAPNMEGASPIIARFAVHAAKFEGSQANKVYYAFASLPPSSISLVFCVMVGSGGFVLLIRVCRARSGSQPRTPSLLRLKVM